MIMLLSILSGLLVALVRRGQFWRLGLLRLRLSWLIFLAVCLQVAVIKSIVPRYWGPVDLGAVLILSSYGGLLAVVLANRSMPGARLIAVGLSLNLIVIAANGGYMPVSTEALVAAGQAPEATPTQSGGRVNASKDIMLAVDETRFPILADVFVLPPPFPIPSIFSLGDVFAAAGVFFLLQRTMVRKDSRQWDVGHFQAPKQG